MLRKHHLRPWQKYTLLAISLASGTVFVRAILDARTLARLPRLLANHYFTAIVGAVLFYCLLIVCKVYPKKRRINIRRLGIAASFAITYLILAMVWDKVIVYIYSWMKRTHLEIVVLALFVALLAWLVISFRSVWKSQSVNRFLIMQTHKYLQRDPRGVWYSHLRQKLYYRRGYECTERRYELALLDWIQPRAVRLQEEILHLEVQHFNNAATKLPTDILSQASTLATYRNTLSEHYYPSYQRDHEKQKDADFVRGCDARRLAAVEQIEAVWLTTKRISRLSGNQNPTEVNAILKTASQVLQELYQHFQALPDTAFPSSLPKAIAQYRLIVLEGADISTLTQNLYALQTRYDDIHFSFGVSLWRIGVMSWLEELATYGDEQAIIQGCQPVIIASLARQEKIQSLLNQTARDNSDVFAHVRQHSLEASISQEADLQREVYRYLGYAWWRHARSLGSNEFGEFAWQRGLENLRMAEDFLALNELQSPFLLEHQ